MSTLAKKPNADGRRTNPLRSIGGTKPQRAPVARLASAPCRRSVQLPSFAPLLEEVEVAGWSSDRHTPAASFHDWLMLDGGRMMLTVGNASTTSSTEPLNAILASQAIWSAIRAHALHTSDAGTLLSLAARSLWSLSDARVSTSVAVALVDTIEASVSLGLAGDCLAWRVRASASQSLALVQPPLGAAADFAYQSQSLQLALRERLVLIADDPTRRTRPTQSVVPDRFGGLDAETHRRMAAADAVALLRDHFEASPQAGSSTSIAAVRRR